MTLASSLGLLFLGFFRIGLFGFGGGLAMLPLIFQTVQDFGLMSAEAFSDLVAVSQVTPGPIAVNAATFVGYHYAGVAGALAATLGVVLPAFLLMMLTMRFLERYRESTLVQGVFAGIRPVTVALIAAATVFLAQTVLVATGSVAWIPCALFAVSAALSLATKIHPILLVAIMAVLGVVFCS